MENVYDDLANYEDVFGSSAIGDAYRYLPQNTEEDTSSES